MPYNLAIPYYNLSLLLDAGVPLLRSLSNIAEGLSKDLKKPFSALADEAAKGKPLAETMAQYKTVFEPLDIMLINAAEISGSLPESLRQLSHWHEFTSRIRKKLLSGMLLPAVIFHIMAFVVPLPGFFLGSWNFNSYIFSVIKILAVFYILATLFYVIINLTPKSGKARRCLDRLAIKIPVLGQAIYQVALSRYCSAFHMLFKAAVPVTDCAEKAVSVTSNIVVADLLAGGIASTKQGKPISEGFSPKLPMDFLDIWKIGEETGKLDDITKKLADNTAESAEFWFVEFARWLPRLVYVLVSIIAIYFIFKLSALSRSSY